MEGRGLVLTVYVPDVCARHIGVGIQEICAVKLGIFKSIKPVKLTFSKYLY